VTGGLQHTDCGNASVIGGITLEFFVRVELQYPNRSTSPNLQPCSGPPCWLFEAHVAERVMYEMLAEANVTVVIGQEGVQRVAVAGRRIVSFTSIAGQEFVGDVFIDASYEGDLLAAANATTTFGREGSAQYGERGAGVQPLIAYDQLPPGVDPLWPGGGPLPLITTPGPFAPVGSSDAKLEAYTYRLCMTRAPSRRVPWSGPPVGYNSSTYELFRRLIAVRQPTSLGEFLFCLGPIPTDAPDCPPDANKTGWWCKCDMISGGALGSDLPGLSWSWPVSTVVERRSIAQAFAAYIAGMLWFLGNDDAVPAVVRSQMLQYGLCADEFTDTEPPYFPHQLYVREARRLVGDFVLTQNPPLPYYLNRTIGLGSYVYDAHTVQRGIVVDNSTGKAEAMNEGEIESSHPVSQPPYRIPYDTLLPARAELQNVLAAVPVSASHVVFTSLRMEPTWMIMGHAAGVAAAMSAADGGAVQDVDVGALQAALVAAGQLITV